MLQQDVATRPITVPRARESNSSGVRGRLATAGLYLALTKPRIISLLLVTTVPAMILAEGGMPSLALIAVTLLGGALAAGGANAINCYLDRDIDGVMSRTKRRPLPSGRVEPERALVFGIALGALGFAVLAIGANLLAAVLAIGALAFYVFVYTVWLKRSSSQNIVIGGAAGAMPPLVGWAAVTGGLDWAAVVLFGIIFLWTPPHFWALALRYRSDYARANVPMLPVVRGEAETKRQAFIYSLALVASTLVLALVAPMGAIYIVSAVVLGAVFVGLAVWMWRSSSARVSHLMFTYSLTYLALIFVAVAVDQLV
jgi:protoheme IX farnesyltransferase